MDDSRSERLPNHNYRCRKCRSILFQGSWMLTCHSEPARALDSAAVEDNKKCHKESAATVLFVEETKLTDWMREQIDQGEWTKGRLTCPGSRCGARVGSFNFVGGEYCPCGKFPLPAIRFNRSKVDEPIGM